MTKNNIIALAIATIILAVVANFALKKEQKIEKAPETIGQFLAPALAKDVNQAKKVVITRANNDVIGTYVLTDNGWVAEHKFNYPVDVAELRKSVLALSEAKTVEPKTASEAFYSEINVQDIAKPDSKAFRMQVFGENDAVLADVLIGKRPHGTLAQNHHFARRPSEKQSWMVTPVLPTAESANAWLDKSLADIDQNDIKTINVTLADGTEYSLEKESKESSFVLSPIPEYKAQQSDTIGNSFAAVLSDLKLEDIPEQNFDILQEGASKTVYTTFDGLVIEVIAKKEGEIAYATLKASLVEVAASETDTVAAEASNENNEDVSNEEVTDTSESIAEPEKVDVSALADELNNKWSGWLFAIPHYKQSNLAKPFDELLKDKPEVEADAQ